MHDDGGAARPDVTHVSVVTSVPTRWLGRQMPGQASCNGTAEPAGISAVPSVGRTQTPGIRGAPAGSAAAAAGTAEAAAAAASAAGAPAGLTADMIAGINTPLSRSMAWPAPS